MFRTASSGGGGRATWRNTWWVFGVVVAVLLCNMLFLHFIHTQTDEPPDHAPSRTKEREDLTELRQNALELQRQARSMLHDNEALLARIHRLTNQGTHATNIKDGPSTGGAESFVEEVKRNAEDLARKLHSMASKAMHDHLMQLQHPPVAQCRSEETRFMVCPMTEGCGFGCALHHATYCFIAALKDNRTVVFENDAKQWPYAKGCQETGRSAGWECYFEPISSCHHSDLDSKKGVPWRPKLPDRVTTVHFWSRPERGVSFLPWASTDGDQTNDPFFILPSIKDILGIVPHGQIGDLRAWFVGQVERYLLRPNSATAADLRRIHAELAPEGESRKERPENVGDWWKAEWELQQGSERRQNSLSEAGEWKHPIAGMHVRRTDHGHEAPFRQVHEYIERIEAWWVRYRAHHPDASRLRIYLATDEPKVIEEATTKYPQYIFLTTKQQGRSSGEGERTGILHTENLLSDVYHLALCDFFVGTASSQVTRMAYEMQQTYGLEHHNWRTFVSLDAPWYFP